MVSVLNELPEVAEPRLLVTSDPHLRVFITYTYHHQIKEVSPEISSEKLEITKLLSGSEKTIVLGGLVPGVTEKSSEAEEEKNLDDADSGMLRIAHLWNTRCGLGLWVLTV